MISYFNKVFIISLEFPKVGKNDKNNISFQIKARLVNNNCLQIYSIYKLFIIVYRTEKQNI